MPRPVASASGGVDESIHYFYTFTYSYLLVLPNEESPEEIGDDQTACPYAYYSSTRTTSKGFFVVSDTFFHYYNFTIKSI
jgi:hypothetical protein